MASMLSSCGCCVPFTQYIRYLMPGSADNNTDKSLTITKTTANGNNNIKDCQQTEHIIKCDVHGE